jgi:exodeoxyribonuclease VIII
MNLPTSTVNGNSIIHRLASDAYHASDALGASTLKLMARSPWHAYKRGVDPGRPPNEPTLAMFAGTLAHCAILEPDEFQHRYAIKPLGHDGRTRDGKQWLSETAAKKLEVITPEQHTTAWRQAEAVRALPDIAALLDGDGTSEVSAFWTQEVIEIESGEISALPCKCRPDRVCETTPREVVLLDIKTCRDASEDAFARAIWNFRYDLQNVWYVDGYEAAASVAVVGMVFVAVESDYPHAAVPYMLEEKDLDRARLTARALAERFAKCKRTGEWPGYATTIQPISLPAWAYS